MLTTLSANAAHAPAPFAPLTRQPVGEENLELKATRFKALEQSADSAKNENHRSPDEHPNDTGEQARLREGSGQDRSYQEQREQQQKQQTEARQQRLDAEQREIRSLSARDREVRAHEQAHAAVGGKHAGSPVYEFVRGPDGVSYAVGGEVKISTSPVPGDPEATIAKAQQLRRAANAPAEPSSQDRQVAAAATRMEVEARAELRQEQLMESKQEAEQKTAQAEARQAEEIRKKEAERETEKQPRELENKERSNFLTEYGQRNIDINRRLIDIGVADSATPIGSFLNRTA